MPERQREVDFTAYDRLAGPVVVTDPDGAIAYCNRAFADLVDRRIEEARGEPLWRFVAEPEAAERLRDAVRGGGAGATFEAPFARGRDGSRTVAFSSSPLKGADDGHELRVLAGVDITEERANHYAEALRLSEERLAVALLSSPAVVFNQDTALRYTWFHSPRDGIAVDDVIGKTDFDLLPEAEAEKIAAVKRGVIKSGVGAREVVSTTIAGEVYHYDLTVEPLRDATGRVVGITGAGWDVTERQRDETQQRLIAKAGALLMTAAESYDATLARLTRLAVAELGDWFGIEIFEEGVLRRWVAPADPARVSDAKMIEELAVDPDKPYLTSEAQAGRSVLLTDVPPGGLEGLAQNDEHRRVIRLLAPCSMICVPLRARGRHLGALVLISSHTTRRYRAPDLRFIQKLAHLVALAVDNAQLYRAAQRAIAARDDVLGVVAHDLRNPLNTIMLQLQLMTRAGKGLERRRQRPIEVIRRASLRMNRLIEEMLDVACLEGGGLRMTRKALGPRSLLEEVCETQRELAAKAGLRLRIEVLDAVPKVYGDRDRLLQALDNLVGNAVKFTPPGGEIVVGAAPRRGEVLFWVLDDGPGIPREHLAHLFDRFWRADGGGRSGAGLGLAIAKGIVASHGGRIWVKSRKGQGTTFYFTVPVAETSSA